MSALKSLRIVAALIAWSACDALYTPFCGGLRDDLKDIEMAIASYRVQKGRCPPPGEIGSDVLALSPGARSEGILDPWGRPLRLQVVDDCVEPYSMGQDGVSGTPDDASLRAFPKQCGGTGWNCGAQ